MTSHTPSTDERQMRKQQIRPRFVDLAELDDDLPEDATSRRAALDSFSNWPPAATVVRKKPPAITSSSKAGASTIRAEAPKALKKPTIEDADESQEGLSSDKARKAQEQTQKTPQAKTVRFDAETLAADKAVAEPSVLPKATLNLAGSIIGSIQERPVGERKTISRGNTRAKPSGSRFVVRRRMDEDLQKHEEQRQQRLQETEAPEGQEPGTGFPVVSHRDQITPILPFSDKSRKPHYSENIDTVEAPQRDALATQTALAESKTGADSSVTAPEAAQSDLAATADEEEWLDEAGKPMSAFRKSRLLRQGQRPPSVRSKSTPQPSVTKDDRDLPDFKPDPTRDPGGGADIDVINAVLSDVSRENDQKLRQMSAAEVSDELRSLESLFGKDILEALRSRKSASSSQETAPNTSDTASSEPLQSTSTSASIQNITGQEEEEDKDGPLAIKRQYFPSEPDTPNPSLEWMMPQPSQPSGSTDLRFDFSGQLLQRGTQTDQTYLSGLHHHGDDQDAPGYTFSELIHLLRSTVAAQRQLALNVLGRICEHYQAFRADDDTEASPATALLNDHALLLRARAISISRWLLGDRHFTVRAAALRCLASAVRSLPSGISIPLGAGQELDFGRLMGAGKGDVEDQDDRADASEVERSIQKDWARVMLESKILDLFLDRTDSVITSKWEAELALELLLRIASCSALHATQIFEKDPRKLSDFVIHLGLKVSWPPVPAEASLTEAEVQRPSSLPSITAVRLLHQGILSDRKIAEAIVLNGSIEHLLRFVVTPPWKVEGDWVSDDDAGDATVVLAYQIFDEVLQLFVSLASYGLFASVVARTWNLWQECNAWAVKQLFGDDDAVSTKGWTLEARSTAAQRIFEVLAAWTRCALDPHELMTAHDITWTQVRDWIEPVHDAAQQMTVPTAARASVQAPAFGALCVHIDAWLRCAMGKEPVLLQKYFDTCQKIASQCQQPISQHLFKVLRLFSSAPTQAIALDEAEQACRACHNYLDFFETLLRAEQVRASQTAAAEPTLFTRGSTVMKQESLALISCGAVWQALQSLESRASGRNVYRRTFSDFVAAALTTSPAGGSGSELPLELAAITRLDVRHAPRVAKIVLRATRTLAGDAIAHTLRPFLLECILGVNRLPEADPAKRAERRDAVPLSQVHSLFKPSRGEDVYASPKPADDVEEEDEEEEKDVDPITGSKLWKCPASGLPIRADWPLLALDDLLHSANTAVFNRPDNLEEGWKPSELDMVRASLQLAVAVFRSMLLRSKALSADSSDELASAEASAILSSLPSAEQVLLGVMKVFMLEKDQPDTFTDKTAAGLQQQKSTGTLTGRDLFRDPSISSKLTSLLDIAEELVVLRRVHNAGATMSSITLDAWTAATYGGTSMSFYQFFTDLVGLWDSVSFGDVNFARAIMTVANAGGGGGVLEGEAGVAVDFRRLVWNDYSDSLRSMPSIRVPDWLLDWADTDEDMLDHYCRYLAGAAGSTGTRKSLAWQIAAHHVRAALGMLDREGEGGRFRRRQTILKSLLAARGEALLRELVGAEDERLVQRLVAHLSVSSTTQ
ncbi:hypothetical protein EX895_000733 [Sporisorium graminicola]|uniref:RNA polymerase II-associated protein 1 C-terminal domain-containing protein n=1 Tax=Sporisorium graminicola TaxID=280036 RepID=A0A4U7L0Q2_9BASI|nr:hypothetical protein EX895_000733 [Sporisorium graminicola]TKY90735.1 hypothetical protein EX895_000733 [Sporisorium graminicola]